MNPLRVLLINPPSINGLLVPMDAKKVSKGGHKPPLGIMYLGAYLQAKGLAQVELLDAQVQGWGVEEVLRRARELQPDLVGITSWTDFWYDISRLCDGLKRELPGCHVCLGGAHVGVFPRESLEWPSVDSIVLGDGERPLAELAASLQEGREPRHPGLYLKARDASVSDFAAYVETDLDSLPFPERTALPFRSYDSLLAQGPMTTMVTSRGCPFHCTFCKLHFQKTLLRSAESVVEEMERIKALGIGEIEIYDDTFGHDRQRVLEICRLMKERGLRFALTTRDRVSNIDDEVLAALKEVGLKRVFLGVESASDATLRRIKKGITVEMARRAVALAKKHGVEVLTYFMLGLPGEDEQDFARTLALAKEMDPDYANFSVTIPYPGTELYRNALAQGYIKRDIWREFVQNPGPDFVMPVYEERYSRDQLLRFHRRTLHQFYFRPGYVLGRLRRVRSWRELAKKAGAGWSLWR